MSVLREFKFSGGRKVYIPSHIWAEMRDLSNACNVEVGALGLVNIRHEGIVVEELYVPEQLVGDAHVQISGAMMSSAQAHFFHQGKIKVGDKNRFVRFNWHSHVDFEAQFSPPDKVQSASMGGDGSENYPPWWISMVQNRAGAYQVYIELFRPIRKTLDITDEIVIGHAGFASQKVVDALTNRVKIGRDDG